MRFKDVFSIIGPSMIGPSSSHTAGAVRLGRCARQALGASPEEAVIRFYGSFADTYMGHGTDLAITAGIMNYDTDDARIRDSIRLAAEEGIAISFQSELRPGPHPNTATILLRRGVCTVRMTGCSIGGGNIELVGVNGFDVKFTAIYPTLLIYHRDRSGILAEITDIAKHSGINISYMEVDRKSRNGEALTVIESDQPFKPEAIASLGLLPDVREISIIDLTNREEAR
ncbi:L-serine ammonia-lyase, iron-sulfur-dependent, subunit beta [Paenibacillus sp. 1011MAR3C5]|uniref:L-serine ammonia-lyase, iron-sulfur-dependent subunit beta n=1 Tax=Paenibacillus sp. 1011MAR3C5 TaxID=1675787 RepID=UPI000E6BB3F1|nr:L-serine ammonia-lyase, iron-sulfur-dependent subunit beta [Paenibacillus sp. 1011MAR3C5]RJE90323.1 L-serine ammonia-lyase, iron-sulfur-dependent, subunit beta [Paenibacillus sp. 1011MAR3C5]